jgi:hypothetical protein
MWLASTHIVSNMVTSHLNEHLENPVTHESNSGALLEFPLYTRISSDTSEKSGVLQLGIQGLADDEVFWFLVQEYQALVSRIMKQQDEQERLTPHLCHKLFIYSCIRAILGKSAGAVQLRGSRQLLRAVRSVTSVANGADSGYELPLRIRRQMTLAAMAAFEAETMQSPIQDASMEEKTVEIKQLAEFENWVYGPDYNVFRVVQASGNISRDLVPTRREEIAALKANLAGSDRLSLVKSLVKNYMDSTPIWIAKPYSESNWRLAFIGIIRILVYAVIVVPSLFLPLLVSRMRAESSPVGIGINLGMGLAMALLHLVISYMVLMPPSSSALVAYMIFNVPWIEARVLNAEVRAQRWIALVHGLAFSWFVPGLGLILVMFIWLFVIWNPIQRYAIAKFSQRYSKWFHDNLFDLSRLGTSDLDWEYVVRLWHLLALYYLPSSSKVKLVKLPNLPVVHLRYSDFQSQIEECLDIMQELDRQVWHLTLLPWMQNSRDSRYFLGERLTLMLAYLKLIIDQMEVLGVELLFSGDDIASEEAFIAAVHREVKNLIERRKKLEEEIKCVSQSSNAT